MKHKFFYILSIVFVFLLLGCTGKEDTTDIVIPAGQKLEDTTPGWFIKAMNLNYTSGKSVTVLMHEHLSKFGTPIDRYKDENDDLHIIWEYVDQKGIIEKYRKSHQGLNPITWHFGSMDVAIIIEEKVTKDGLTFTFKYPPPGVPWNKLISADNIGFSMDRKNMVVVKSQSDKYTRIFLFGQGNFCTEIVVF